MSNVALSCQSPDKFAFSIILPIKFSANKFCREFLWSSGNLMLILKGKFVMRLPYASLTLLGLLGTLAVTPVVAQVTAAPTLVNFQGRLATPAGNPVPDGTYSIRFSLWDAASAGTEKWNQTLDSVQVKNGTFAVLLNTNTAGLFNGNLYLEIKIGTDAALTPRQQLVTVPYAFKADMALTVPDASITNAKIAPGTITADRFASNIFNPLAWLLGGNSGVTSGFIGTTDNNPLVFRTNNAEAMRLGSNGNLSIGTSNTASKLALYGGTLANTAGSTLPLTSLLGSTSNGVYLNTFLSRSAAGTDWTTAPIVIQRVTDVTNQAMLSFYGDNIGIGTATPGARLHVKGGGNNVAVFAGDLSPFGAAPFETNISTAAVHAWFAENGARVFSVAGGGTGYFAGNVGIGTSTPRSALEVNGNIQMSGVRTKLFYRGDNSDGTHTGSLGLYTGNGGLTAIITPYGATGNLLPNSTISLGGFGAYESNTVNLQVSGEVTAKVVTITGGSDVAEPYNVAPAGKFKAVPGMLVCIDGAKVGQMRVASKAYDTTVAGIISGANGIHPGITLRQKGTVADGTLPVASIGRVWCWCDADANGAIEAGNMLTTSNTPGHAMKATSRERRDGAVIGKAMSSLKSGKGLVLVLVSLK